MLYLIMGQMVTTTVESKSEIKTSRSKSALKPVDAFQEGLKDRKFRSTMS